MSKLALHIEHMKRGEVGAIDRHNRRSGEVHSNEDIDPARTPWNIAVVQPDGGLWSAVQTKVEEVKERGARVTAGSVVCSEWVIYPPEDLQDPFTADRERLRSWSGDVLDWMKSQGIDPEQAIIHMDETTVHMHVDSVPLTADGRLSRKDIYTRSALTKFHSELAKHLSERGWDIQRGDTTKGKGVKSKSTKEYKREQEKKVAQLEKRAEELTRALEPAERLSAVQVKESAFGGSVKLSKDDYEALKRNAEAVGVLQSENDRFRAMYERERERAEEYRQAATLTISERIRLADAEKAVKTLEKIEKRLDALEKQTKLIDKLIMHLPSFIADKLKLRELEKASGFSFQDYWDFRDTMRYLREEAERVKGAVTRRR